MGPSRHQAKAIQTSKINVKEQCEKARQYIILNGCSKQVAIDTLELTISRHQLDRYKPDDPELPYVHSVRRILTDNEENQLIEWLIESARIKKPKTRSDQRNYIKQILMIRNQKNKSLISTQ